MRRHLLAAAVAALVLAVPAAAPAQDQGPPEPLDDFDSYPVDATSLQLCWDSEDADQVDSWTLYMQRGTTPPPPGSPPAAEVPGGSVGVCHRVDGLEEGEPYSFALVGHNEAGDGPRQTITTATRVPGAFVRGPFGTRLLPETGEYGNVALAVVRRTGRLDAAYLAPVPGSNTDGIYHASRARHGGWSKPTLVAPSNLGDQVIAVDDAGAVAIGWNSSSGRGPGYRVRRAGARRWGPIRHLPRGLRATLSSLAFDRRGDLHIAVTRPPYWPGTGVHVLTNHKGRWTDTRLPGTKCGENVSPSDQCRALLATDPVTGRLTVVARHTSHGVGTVLVADAPPGAKRFGRLHRVASARSATLELMPGALTRYAGHITLALRGVPPFARPDDARGAGLYLATGSSPARMGHARRIAGTGVQDSPAVALAAVDARTTLLAWQHGWVLPISDQPEGVTSWNPDEQGVWVRRIVRDRRTGRPHLRAPQHVDDSAFAQLFDVAADRRGRPIVAFGR